MAERSASGSALELAAPRAVTRHTHRTGCTLASALAALLGRGLAAEEAVRQAKAFTLAAIRSGGQLGRGTGSLWHAAWRTEADTFPAAHGGSGSLFS